MIISNYKHLPETAGKWDGFKGVSGSTKTVHERLSTTGMQHIGRQKVGGETHAHKVAGDLASASDSLYWLDDILLCDFNGVSLFIWL